MENEGNLSFLIPIIMVERFLSQTSFTTQEDFIKNFKINVPENFNFGYDVVDAWAAEQPDKPAAFQYQHYHVTMADAEALEIRGGHVRITFHVGKRKLPVFTPLSLVHNNAGLSGCSAAQASTTS